MGRNGRQLPPAAKGRQEAIWPTSLVLFTLGRRQRCHSSFRKRSKKTAAYLLGIKGKVPETALSGELHDIDLKLTGWPWAEGNFSWVEPTAWACLALRHFGQGSHPRVQEGMRLLLDRAMDEGGINYGNRRILGRLTEPIPGPSALMLLALQPPPSPPSQGGDINSSPPCEGGEGGVAENHPRINAAAGYLMSQINCGDLEHLCWMKLALDLYRSLPGVEEALPKIDAAILAAHEERAQTNWLRPAPLRQALTALALGTGRKNFFRLPKSETRGLTPVGSPGLITAFTADRSPGMGQRFGSWFRGLAIKGAGSSCASSPCSLRSILPRQAITSRTSPLSCKSSSSISANGCPSKENGSSSSPTWSNTIATRSSTPIRRWCRPSLNCANAKGPVKSSSRRGRDIGATSNTSSPAAAWGTSSKKHQVQFVDINHDEPVKVPNAGRLTGLGNISSCRAPLPTPKSLISLPKLKTHHWAGSYAVAQEPVRHPSRHLLRLAQE